MFLPFPLPLLIILNADHLPSPYYLGFSFTFLSSSFDALFSVSIQYTQGEDSQLRSWREEKKEIEGTKKKPKERRRKAIFRHRKVTFSQRLGLFDPQKSLQKYLKESHQKKKNSAYSLGPHVLFIFKYFPFLNRSLPQQKNKKK